MPKKDGRKVWVSNDWRNYEPTTWDAKQAPIQLPDGQQVKFSDIKAHFTDYYFSALAIWQRWRRFGLPFDGGWAEQPEYLIRVIETLEAIYEDRNGGS